MLTSLLKRLEPVHVASTPQEREAIYRFRYTVYVEELGYEVGGVNHAAKTVSSPDDEAEHIIHLYTGTPEALTGALRMSCWGRGDQVPPHDFETLSMSRLPGIADLNCCELGRFMIHPEARGKFILPSLASRAIDILLHEKKIDLIFCYCRPPLVPSYQKLGFRLYDAPPFSTSEGLVLPMVALLFDPAHLKRVGAPIARAVGKADKRRERPRPSLEAFDSVFGQQSHRHETDPELVWETIQGDLLGGGAATAGRMPEHLLSSLAKKALIISASAGQVLAKEGRTERELYIVLDGHVDVLGSDGRRLRLLGPGEVFGEVALFREDHRRTATVRAVDDCRLVVVRRSFLDGLVKKEPKKANEVLMALSGIMADRIVSLSDEVGTVRQPSVDGHGE